MQAIEAMGTIDAQGQLLLDQPLQVSHPSRVRVIVLLTESLEPTLAESQPDLASSQTRLESNHTQTDHTRDTRPIWERVADISAQVPLKEWAMLPRDLSKNLDHYLYGSPKEDE